MDNIIKEKIEILEINQGNYKGYSHSLTKAIKLAFETVAETYEISNNERPSFAAFIDAESVSKKIETGVIYIAYRYEGEIIACLGIKNNGNGVFSFVNIAVVPKYQGRGLGVDLLHRAEMYVWSRQGIKIKLGLIEEDEVRYKWYVSLGYVLKQKKNFGKTKKGVIFMEKVQFNKKITKNQNQCLKCGMTQGTCICGEAQITSIQTRIVLLTHESEINRISNTGRLIKRLFPKNTHIVIWSRTEISRELERLLSDDEFDNYLVFPEDLAPNMVATKELDFNKKNAFFVIDGTWKEAKKILRKSPYLHDLPIIELDIQAETQYFIRRKSDEHHLCTAEIVMEVLKTNRDEIGYSALKAYYGLFLEKYKEARSGVK